MKISNTIVKTAITSFLIGVVLTILVTHAQTLSNFAISGGIYPGAPDYTIWVESGTYYSKDANGLMGTYGSNATTVIQTIENIVDDNGGIIYLKDVQLPSNVVLSVNVIVIEDYQGEINYYNEYNMKLSIMKKYFVDDAFYQTEIMWERGDYYNGRTYVSYQDDELNPYAMFYDHNYQYWSDPVRVGTNPLSGDSHGTPALLVDFNGNIHVFWGSHSGSGTASHSKSTNPEDISAWTSKAEMPPGASATYPHTIRSLSRLYYWYRDTVSASQTTYDYVYSDDNGESWSSENIAVNIGANWGMYPGNLAHDSTNDRIYFSWTAFNTGGNGSRSQWCYVAYLDVTSGNCYSVGGTNLGTTIDMTEMCDYCDLADAGSGNTADSAILRLNSTEFPMAIYAIYNGSGHWLPRFTRWTGSAWTSGVSITHADAHCADRDFLLVNNDVLEAYMVVGQSPSNWGGHFGIHGRLDLFTSTDTGATWLYNRTIVNFYPEEGLPIKSARVVGGYQNELKIIITPMHNTYYGTEIFNYGSPMYAWGDDGFVYRRYDFPS